MMVVWRGTSQGQGHHSLSLLYLRHVCSTSFLGDCGFPHHSKDVGFSVQAAKMAWVNSVPWSRSPSTAVGTLLSFCHILETLLSLLTSDTLRAVRSPLPSWAGLWDESLVRQFFVSVPGPVRWEEGCGTRKRRSVLRLCGLQTPLLGGK